MGRIEINFDFWRVIMPSGVSDHFESLLDYTWAQPVANRLKRLGGDPVRLRILETTTDGRRIGEVLRIRMDDLPERAKLTGDVTPLDLAEDEGIGECAAFLYDPLTSVLIFQRRRASLSAGNTIAYFEQFWQGDRIDLDVVLTRAAARKMLRMQTYKRFEARAAGITNMEEVGQVLREAGENIKGLAKLLDEAGSPNLHLVLAAGRDRSLAKRTIDALVSGWKQIAEVQPKNIKKLELQGRGPDDEKLIVDLIEDRRRARIRVESDERRRATYEAKRAAVIEVFEATREELVAQFVDQRRG